MQVTEMRPFYTHKHLINLTLKHRPFISFRTFRPPLFLRSSSDASSSPAENSPSSGPGNGNSSSNNRRVWTVHDPLTGRLAPQRGQKEESGSGSGSGSGGDGRRTYLDKGERVYGNAKKAQSEGGSEASRSFGRRVEGFGEEGKGQGFWVCSHCCHREAQRWETCRVCMCTGTMKLVTESCNQTGGFGVAGYRYNVVEGSGNGFHKEVDNFSGERALEQMSSGGAKQEQEWASGGEAHRGMAHSGNEGHDLNIGMSSENVKISEDIVGNRLSELEVSEKALKQVGGGVNPLPLTMKPEVESASDDVTYVRLPSSGNRISDFHGSVEKANFAVANHEKGVEYFSSEGLGSREHAVPSSIRDQGAEVLPLPKSMKQESESTSQNEIQMASSNSGNRPDDLDIDRTEGSSKKAKLVSRAESRSDFDEGVKEVSRERAFRVVEKGSSRHGVGQEFSIGDILTTSMRKKKSKMAWVCKKCGHTEVQWWGSCKMCGRVGSMRQISVGDSGGSGDESGMVVSENGLRSLLPKQDKAFPMRLIDVNCGINEQDWRIPLSGSLGSEVARVLGGGIVPGSLVLVGGDPGVGKSTLLLQVASLVAQGQDIEEPRPVVYVSGEESMEQIGNRADRMGIETDELFLYSGTDVEDILEKTHLLSPRLLIVDSIQTVYLKGVTGSAGGVTQVKECTSSLLRYAKKTNIPVLLIGHVTKTGEIAGPQVLEHIVDVVLYLEGEKHTSHRLLRSIKNRFGSTDELGVFEMLQSGLQSVSNPSEMYLTEQYTDSDFLAGLAVAVVVDGTRTFVIEIQALCAAGCSRGSRHFNGVQDSRADMIISVLVKQAGLKLQESSIYLNVVSGVTLSETAGDLAIAAAICSSFLEFPIPTGIAFIGEIGLSGELRAVPRMDFRINTVAQLGYKKCIVPQSVLKSLKGIDHKEMQIIGCKNLKNVINTVFTTP